jgi:HPt (histidine-containing phosphotransfer) domain-containing protein
VSEPDDLDRELREYYLSLAQGKVDGLADALAGARGDPADPACIERVRMLVHKIAGSAGAYGFDALGASAKSLEREILAAARPISSAVLGAIELFLARMTAEFAAARAARPR